LVEEAEGPVSIASKFRTRLRLEEPFLEVLEWVVLVVQREDLILLVVPVMTRRSECCIVLVAGVAQDK
jgi:hypothetical protein